MATVNKITLIGNVGNNPEVRHLPDGTVVAQISPATNERYTNKKGEVVEQTQWHRIELWESAATYSQNYVKKGDSLYIEGKLRSEKWTDANGQEKQTWKVRANSIQKLSASA